jgi:uncharacterized membrane protein YphA (DoxX/SURF4 family)
MSQHRATIMTTIRHAPSAPWWPRVLNLHAELFRLCRNVAWPAFDLAVRVTLAQGFFISGVLKVTNWQAALYLAENEYRVSWMDPVAAAYTGAAIELIAPVLLAFGLMTRYAAVPMLILSLVVQVSYNPLDSQLFAAALLGWYAINGAGPLSLDRLLRRGLSDSALPLAPRILRSSEWIRAHLSGPYLALVRLWLAMALLLAALQGGSLPGLSAQRLALALPLSSALAWPAPLSVACGLLLLLGLASRYAAIVLIITAAATAMMHSLITEEIYLLATLALLALRGGGHPAADAGCERDFRSSTANRRFHWRACRE